MSSHLHRGALALVLFVTLGVGQASLVDVVRTALAQRDFAGADRTVEAYQRQRGIDPQLALAISWEGREALAAKDLDRAEVYADRARDLSLQLLKSRKLDAEPNLPLALGASIEVHAQVMAARGQISSAVGFLQTSARTYAKTSLLERINKNVNLLSLKGKPAPSLDAAQWIGAKPPTVASLRGKPILLFFWAHWCPDCKAEAPVLASAARRYAPRGLILMAPTRYYGYVEGGQEAAPAAEKSYIEQIRNRYYAQLAAASVPLSNTIFATYGCSSTPTLALIDKMGIVRWYHPGTATEAELIREIEAVL
ncbi:MAG: TlpA disulfide reductase family protein [Acidobacteriota bacterium]